MYDFHTLKEAILFNTQEVLPNNPDQLDQEIRALIQAANDSGEQIRHYIGFEISGQIHIGTGIASALKIKKLQDAGVKCSIFLADYHTYLNNKLDGKFETIRKVATEYFGPVMMLCCDAVGCDVEDIDLVLAKNLYETTRNGQNYWTFDMKIGKELSLNRVLKSISIMGKEAGDNVEFGTLRYPVMQVTDAFFMQTHLVHAGLDQRKCHVLMRETAPKLDDDFALRLGKIKVKPIAIHHSLLLALAKPQDAVIETHDLSITEQQNLLYLQQEVAQSGTVNLSDIDETVAKTTLDLITQHHTKTVEVNKMSKSKPDGAVWVHDTPEEIMRKLKKAYCPMPRPDEQSTDEIAQEQLWNPILDWTQKMIFPAGRPITIERKEEWGGNATYQDFGSLKADYFTGKIHPMDLKNAVGKNLADWFAPIRKWAEENDEAVSLVRDLRK
jgi:tyrosyl-tRNA synthetase